MATICRHELLEGYCAVCLKEQLDYRNKRIEQLTEALQPFAEAAPYYEGCADGDALVRYYSDSRTGKRGEVLVRDFRRAVSALAVASGKEEKEE